MIHLFFKSPPTAPPPQKKVFSLWPRATYLLSGVIKRSWTHCKASRAEVAECDLPLFFCTWPNVFLFLRGVPLGQITRVIFSREMV